MKNKIAALLLVLCMMLSCGLFAACGEVKDVDINAAIEKTEALDSISADFNMEMIMSMEGFNMTVPVTAEVNAKGIKGDNPVISTKVATSLFGQSIDMEIYQEDGWMYFVMGDMKYKTSADSEADTYNYYEDIDDMLQLVPEELLKDVEAKKNSDGSQTVTLSLSDEKFNELYKDIIGAASKSMGASGDGIKISVSDASVSVTVAGEYVSAYDIGFKMSAEAEGVTTEAEVKVSVKFNNPGKDVTVTPPEGYESFEGFDASDMFGDMTDEDLYGEDGDSSDIYGDVTDELNDAADQLDDMLNDLGSLFE